MHKLDQNAPNTKPVADTTMENAATVEIAMAHTFSNKKPFLDSIEWILEVIYEAKLYQYFCVISLHVKAHCLKEV